MKNNYLTLSIVILVIIMIVFGFSYYRDVKEYNKIISRKDSTIKNMRINDTVFLQETKKYSSIITKYVKDSIFTIGDVKYTASQLIKIIVDMENQLSSQSRLMEQFDESFLARDRQKTDEIWNLQFQIDRLLEENSKIKDSLKTIKNKYSIEIDKNGNLH